MVNINKQTIVDDIVNALEKGQDRAKIMSDIISKCQFTTRTFERYWKTANEQHAAKQKQIKEALAEVDKAAAIESRKKAIMTADERKEYLTKLISGEIKAKIPFVIGGKIMEYPSEPSHSDRIKALAELNKMEGDYAPTKVAQTNKDGEDIPIITAIQFISNNSSDELPILESEG